MYFWILRDCRAGRIVTSLNLDHVLVHAASVRVGSTRFSYLAVAIFAVSDPELYWYVRSLTSIAADGTSFRMGLSCAELAFMLRVSPILMVLLCVVPGASKRANMTALYLLDVGNGTSSLDYVC